MELRTKVENQNENSSKVAIKKLEEIKNSNSNIHKGHRARLKNQFIENGFETLTDIQKLELVLFFAIPQKDTNPIAHNLINHFGNLKNIMLADYNELMSVSGIKENSALLINLINSFVHYCHLPEEGANLSSSENTIEFVKNLFHGINVEQFYVICLSKNNIVKKVSLINSGTKDEVNVQIRKITECAIENKINRIIICHNHPDGPASMSDEDCSFTYSIICSCMLNSIDVLDHVIVGQDRCLSLVECEVMKKLKKKAYDILHLSKDKELFLSSSSKSYIQSKITKL